VRALRAFVFLGSSIRETGRCAPLPHDSFQNFNALRCFLNENDKNCLLELANMYCSCFFGGKKEGKEAKLDVSLVIYL
jgi:hypothetical protein